ncbi:hypothetical protein ACQEVC_05915 [Plantactinospora sp. CA-294935]|uniref:hypothetical protein n=1 Tax=Plantactinospora sp. CA-294935 TaxID=3240012 RepID=UPI003D90AFB3
MVIKPEMVEYIRTMVRGQYAENDRLEAKLDDEGWDDFPTLLGIVFYYAVERRFGSGATQEEVIRFVAEMRAAAPAEAAAVIDANAAETLVRAALDPDLDSDVEPEMAGAIQGMVVVHVLGAPEVTDDDLDTLLRKSEEVASRL